MRLFLGAFAILLSMGVIADEVKLELVSGTISSGGTGPVYTWGQMVALAKAEALKQIDLEKYIQVSSEWHVDGYCNRGFRTSMWCYKGTVTATASFVSKEDVNKSWYVRGHGRGFSADKAMQNAEAAARLYCNRNITPDPWDVQISRRDPYEVNYSAYFHCVEQPQ